MIVDRRLSVASALTLALSVSAPPAYAQEGTVRDVLSFLVTNQAVVTDDFVKDQEAAAATRDTIFRFLQVELASLPISSSSGGFIYRLNPSIATMERVSDSFGPFFLERSLTSGRGQTSIGVSFRHSRFDSLDGRSLNDGTLVTTANRLANESEPFDVERLTLGLEANTITLFGNYGITDRFDIGAAMPIVDLSVSGERRNTYRGAVLQQAIGSGFVTGLADIALRAKYSVLQTRTIGFAANVDARLPTGDEDQLLGAGEAAIYLSGIASVESGRVGWHLKGGFGQGGVSDEVNAGAAMVVSLAPRFNVIGEVFGRRLSELERVGDSTAPHPFFPNVTTTRLLPTTTGTSTGLALAGFKWNLTSTWLFNANVLFPLNDRGLARRPTASIAIDYTLERPR
jgi:hypothetical protein